MVSALSSWAEQIIIAVIIATIFEMLIPDSKNKKYVKTVIGLYILFTILSPIIKNVSGGKFSLAESSYFNRSDNSNKQFNSFDEVTNSNIEDTYILSLKKDLVGKLIKKGYDATLIKIDIETKDEENYGQINKLSFKISRRSQENNSNSKSNNSQNNILINKIEIGNTTKKEISENSSTITNNEIKELKDYLYSEYGVNPENININ